MVKLNINKWDKVNILIKIKNNFNKFSSKEKYFLPLFEKQKLIKKISKNKYKITGKGKEYIKIKNTRRSKGFIYAIIFPNKKRYVGQSKNYLYYKKNCHKKRSLDKTRNEKLYRAIRRYGFKNLKWEILKKDFKPEYLDKYEKYYIKKYDSIKNGYNTVEGGKSPKGRKVKESTKKIISKKLKKYFKANGYPESAKIKMSKTISGKNHWAWGKKISKKQIRKKIKADVKYLWKFISPRRIAYENILYWKIFCKKHKLNINRVSKVFYKINHKISKSHKLDNWEIYRKLIKTNKEREKYGSNTY